MANARSRSLNHRRALNKPDSYKAVHVLGKMTQNRSLLTSSDASWAEHGELWFVSNWSSTRRTKDWLSPIHNCSQHQLTTIASNQLFCSHRTVLFCYGKRYWLQKWGFNSYRIHDIYRSGLWRLDTEKERKVLNNFCLGKSGIQRQQGKTFYAQNDRMVQPPDHGWRATGPRGKVGVFQSSRKLIQRFVGKVMTLLIWPYHDATLVSDQMECLDKRARPYSSICSRALLLLVPRSWMDKVRSDTGKNYISRYFSTSELDCVVLNARH